MTHWELMQVHCSQLYLTLFRPVEDIEVREGVAAHTCKVWVIMGYHSVIPSCLLMADLEYRFHPLGCEGADGEDDEARTWLDGNRPIYWNEEEAKRRQSDRHPDRVRDGKDDRLGLLDEDEDWSDFNEMEMPLEVLMYDHFVEERVMDPLDESMGPQTTSQYFHPGYNTTMCEGSENVEEAHRELQPLSYVEQYSARIFTRRRHPDIGQTLATGERRALLPVELRNRWTSEEAKLEAGEECEKRWELARLGGSVEDLDVLNGYMLVIDTMRERRQFWGPYFPSLSNMEWYLNSSAGYVAYLEWYRNSAGSQVLMGARELYIPMSLCGVQLVIAEAWGGEGRGGYDAHQTMRGSWFARATRAEAERILQLMFKCPHTRPSMAECNEYSICDPCGMLVRFADMGFLRLACFMRFVQAQHQSAIFDYIYPLACEKMYKLFGWLYTHVNKCPHHPASFNEARMVNRAVRAQCFKLFDRHTSSADDFLLAEARKRLAARTRWQLEHLMSEGSLFDRKYPSTMTIESDVDPTQPTRERNW